MVFLEDKRRLCVGWRGALSLIIIYLATELGFNKLGGDWGAFLYVTFHFIVSPLLSIGVIVLTFIEAYRTEKLIDKIVLISSVIIPAFIVSLAITGDIFFMKLLSIDFNK